jgi:formate hydrogenlyase subunit 6/NADH:ubiquinone oxidoreductase subunit I
MAIDEVKQRLENARKPGLGIGLLKSMAVTLKHLFKHNTVIQYPTVKQDLAPRTRGVIALKEENCTVCMLCARECPDWCIYIDSHKETLAPKREGGRQRKRNVLDRFAIDYALCMYCGICVEVCPYDALFWSREFEYAEYDIRELTHEKEKLSDWMSSVLPPPALEEGALQPGQPLPEEPAAAKPAPESPEIAPVSKPAAAATPTTPTASAAEARPEQAATAPKAPTAAPLPPAASDEEQAPAPAKTAEVQEQEVPAAKAETDAASTPAPAPTPTEDPEAAYERVLQEQRDAGASPQVAEARAKVARVKAERGIGRGPTPVATDKRVPSAPVKGEPEPTPPGAPEAEEPRPEQGPVAPTSAEAAPEVEPAEDPDEVYERVLAEERAKGSSDQVATARAKAARIRAVKGTKGPGG